MRLTKLSLPLSSFACGLASPFLFFFFRKHTKEVFLISSIVFLPGFFRRTERSKKTLLALLDLIISIVLFFFFSLLLSLAFPPLFPSTRAMPSPSSAPIHGGRRPYSTFRLSTYLRVYLSRSLAMSFCLSFVLLAFLFCLVPQPEGRSSDGDELGHSIQRTQGSDGDLLRRHNKSRREADTDTTATIQPQTPEKQEEKKNL